MCRSVLYIPGASHHLFEQSAELVADRIARALQGKLALSRPFSYRVTVESGVRRYHGIPVDVATIEIRKREPSGDQKWRKLMEVIELKYLPVFTRPFASRSPLGRAIYGLWLLVAAMLVALRELPARAAAGLRRLRAKRSERPSGTVWRRAPFRDASQGILHNTRNVGILLRSLVLWAGVGLAAGIAVPSLLGADIRQMMGTVVGSDAKVAEYEKYFLFVPLAAFLLALYYGVRKNKMEQGNRTSEEAFALLDYYANPEPYRDVLNAILDAAADLAAQGSGPITLLSLSLGAIVTADAAFPRTPHRPLPRKDLPCGLPCGWDMLPPEPKPAIESWVTIGFPYEFVESARWRYFAGREARMLDIETWYNVWIPYDYLASQLAEEQRGIGFADNGPALIPKRDNEWWFVPGSKRWKKPSWTDLFLLQRQINHCLYWDDTNARSPTCFEAIVERLRWTKDVEALLYSPSTGDTGAGRASERSRKL